MADLLASIEDKLLKIKESLSSTDDNCFQYYFVKDDELRYLKADINQISKKNLSDLNYWHNFPKFLEEEFNELIDSNFNFIDGLKASTESTPLSLKNIIIKGDEHNASYELHQDFNNFFEKYMFNILYYYKIDNCDLDQCGTGIVFIDKNGKRRYEILPVYPGLIIVLRDKCMFHHTPNIKPINEHKPIIRTMIRKYVGFDRYENDKNRLLQSIHLDKTIINKNIKNLEEKIRETQDEDLIASYNDQLKKLHEEYIKINEKEYNKMIFKTNHKYYQLEIEKAESSKTPDTPQKKNSLIYNKFKLAELDIDSLTRKIEELQLINTHPVTIKGYENRLEEKMKEYNYLKSELEKLKKEEYKNKYIKYKNKYNQLKKFSNLI